MTPEVEQIKERLRGCRTLSELRMVKDRHRARVREMEESPTLRVMAIQIKNLAAYRWRELEGEDADT